MTKRTVQIFLFTMIVSIIFGYSNFTNASEIKNLFGMDCKVTRISTSGIPSKTVFTPDNYNLELDGLKKKGYTRIDMIKEYTQGDQNIKILLGEKCGHDVLRINQEESVNDIGVDHIEKRGNILMMYGAKDGYATMIACDLSTQTGNTYISFETVKSKSDSTKTSVGTGDSGFSSSKLVLEKKNIHPQDSLNILRQPVSEIIKTFGGNWSRDRKELANMLGIQNYRGTKQQNLQIRKYLLSYISIDVVSTNTTEIVVSTQEYQKTQQQVVSDVVKMRDYSRKYDRRGLFQEIGGFVSYYRGTRLQNLQIRKYLLNKIKTK